MFKLGDSPLRHLTLRAAMLRALVGSWMTLIVLLLGATPCSAPFVAPVRGGLLRVKVSCSVVVWLFQPFMFDSVYAPICPNCNNNAPSCTWAKDGSPCPTVSAIRNNELCLLGKPKEPFTIAGLIKPEYQRPFQLNHLDTILTLAKRVQPGTIFEFTAKTALNEIIRALAKHET